MNDDQNTCRDSRPRHLRRRVWRASTLVLVMAFAHDGLAQSPAVSTPVRRLPPLTNVRSSQQAVDKTRPAVTPTPVKQSATDIQLTSAVEATRISDLPLRRLPPLTTVFSASNSPTRRMQPAHIENEAPGSRPADGVARILPGSLAVSGKAIYLGVPPRAATTQGDLGSVGRSTLEPSGVLPKVLPSPINRSQAR